MLCESTFLYSSTCRYDLTCTVNNGGTGHITTYPEKVEEYRDTSNPYYVCKTIYLCGC
jgi:hypothetical protein